MSYPLSLTIIAGVNVTSSPGAGGRGGGGGGKGDSGGAGGAGGGGGGGGRSLTVTDWAGVTVFPDLFFCAIICVETEHTNSNSNTFFIIIFFP
ncbi:MAG: hypothetical protein ABIO79_06015 [Ferruginibacter sp.]